MNTELIQALGLSPEKLQEMIVERAVEELLGTRVDGDDIFDTSNVAKAVSGLVKEKINEHIESAAREHLLPKLETMLDELVLQQTNEWGEKRGQPVTVTEYLVQRADAYMREQVDLNGKSKEEARDSYWRASTSRVAHAIDQHLKYHISTAMEKALKDANTSIAKGLHEACRVAINEAAQRFTILAKT